MSSFSGKIKEFPQISTDRFDGRNLASTAYFLSHAHSDHMHGLSSPQFLDHLESNSGVYLYCSPITARFLQASIRHQPLTPFICPLQTEESVKITVPNVAEEATHQLWVTLIPAAHCPGSVMFLFEGRGGTVLYTGDFRISGEEATRLTSLHNQDGTVKLIDSLHIDTTFCHRDIMHFPSREESAQAVAELVEDWLARGNNFLIHLVCSAAYGYEYIYRSLHERFGMKIHVSRWKYRMYDTVPEIQDMLTLDATTTWIHACDWSMRNENIDVETATNRQLPCQCVPFGVDTQPNIRVIKPSALFYTMFQSAKEIKQLNQDGTFCRVLLSMHASCTEVLDLVSYLRPRKVFPNVIPINSTKEEVLKLLHEALNRAGDHYSIEYGGNQRPSLGSFKRQLHNSEISCSMGSSSGSNLLDAGLLDVYFTSPNKKRRHSDSNMTLVLPAPRGNIKGSLSLEGESRQQSSVVESTPKLSITDSDGESIEWKDPYSQTPPKYEGENAFFQSSCESVAKEPSISNSASRCSTDLFGGRNEMKKSDSQDSSVSSEGGDSVFSESCRSGSLMGESAIKQSRKMWYKHKYFSTPIHDEVDKVINATAKPNICPRSSSLPLPEEFNRTNLSSPHLFSCTDDSILPVITVSSPSDQASDSQVSDETNFTIVLSSGEPSDCDPILPEEVNDNVLSDNDNNNEGSRPSVICSPSGSDQIVIATGDELRTYINHSVKRRHEPEWIDCNKLKINRTMRRTRRVTLNGGSLGSSQIVDLVHNKRIDEEVPLLSRSSCLKTTRRTQDQVEVVSFDQFPPL